MANIIRKNGQINNANQSSLSNLVDSPQPRQTNNNNPFGELYTGETEENTNNGLSLVQGIPFANNSNSQHSPTNASREPPGHAIISGVKFLGIDEIIGSYEGSKGRTNISSPSHAIEQLKELYENRPRFKK